MSSAMALKFYFPVVCVLFFFYVELLYGRCRNIGSSAYPTIIPNVIISAPFILMKALLIWRDKQTGSVN